MRDKVLLINHSGLATIAMGVIVVADIAAPHERGSYVGAMLTG